MFTIGTGVGGGIVIDGRIYRGATGAAAELGHTIVGADLRGTPFRRSDDFPQPGSLESLAAGRVLNELGRELGLPDASTVDAAREGHAGACAAIDLLGRRLGIGIANAINTFDPDLSSSAAASRRRATCCSRPRARRPRASSSTASARRRGSCRRATARGPACAARRCSPARRHAHEAGVP